jgi:hypothetical protein
MFFFYFNELTKKGNIFILLTEFGKNITHFILAVFFRDSLVKKSFIVCIFITYSF